MLTGAQQKKKRFSEFVKMWLYLYSDDAQIETCVIQLVLIKNQNTAEALNSQS